MNLLQLKPRKALNKAFLKVKANRDEIEVFKANLIKLIDNINETESEEHHKNLVSDFLKNTYYGANHYINTKGRNDLVIHNGNKASDTVGVIVEAKSPTNKVEMLKTDNLNTKAFQELVLYYLRERITHKNLEIKHLLASNIYEWFIFDANVFEKEFAQNKNLVKQFVDFEEGRLVGKTTDFFYTQIAQPAIEAIKDEVVFTYFDIRDYDKPLRNAEKKDDTVLIALYKLLSPEHLLKLPFANDSNSLDKTFYAELLHIIGLTETKDGGKKLIQRKKEGERNSGSLLESAIFQLENLDKITRLNKPQQFGETYQERLFNVALELAITWVNRILFLKLLEAQLLKYNKGNKSFSFLNLEKVESFDDLNNLFFSVLARKLYDRSEEVKKMFANVPYLNSSLFEPTEIEHSCLFISQLKDGKLPLLPATVIKNNTGQKLTGELVTIHYIFEFLNAYDFASEGSEEIQEDNKKLINASVLGLIFEKINGYKDGSFFTPGFITMYMCHETIRRAVVQKFNEAKGWNCTHFSQLYNKIEDRNEANAIINSLKICDISVGSGHFLVSALNEIIAIKSELRILQDRDGNRLKEYTVVVENDELVVSDEDGKLFEYVPKSKESQRVQETLFHEKQTIIENCLFGVDINPNSVKICRLRLWIELLKNAYYKAPDYTELETLPNIDINIKCGNSLISRYALDADIKKALRASKWTIDSYKIAVMTYRNAKTKEEKRDMERLITQIKTDFESEVAINDKRLLKLNKTKGDLFALTTQVTLFERTKAEKAAWDKQVKTLSDTITQLENELEEIKSNKIYDNAFEWRFEFPEVLNDDGEFMGFDVVIGNPPYIRQEEFIELKSYLYQNYNIYNSISDLLTYFVELGYNILKENGTFKFIISNKFTRANYGKEMRLFLSKKTQLSHFIDFSGVPVFDEATVDAAILGFNKLESSNSNFIYANIKKNEFETNNFNNYLESIKQIVAQNLLPENTWNFEKDEIVQIKKKVEQEGVILKNWDIKINRGFLTGYNDAFIINTKTKDKLIAEHSKSADFIRPMLRGKDIKPWQPDFADLWVIFIPKGFTIKRNLPKENPNYISEPPPRYGNMEFNDAWFWFSHEYPAIANHLLPYQTKAELRQDKGDYWWEQRACSYIEEFNKPKIIYVELSKQMCFAYDTQRFYPDKTCFFISSNNELKYLSAFLNSKLFKMCFKDNFSVILGETRVLSKIFFEQIPVKQISIDEQKPFIELVDRIIDLKQKGEATTSLEAEIDQLVYELYGLSAEEIRIVEGKG